MATTVTVTQPCNTNLSQNITLENNLNHLGDASFAAYLGGGNEASVLKLGESTWSPSSSMKRKSTNDGEISIFSAEKYFNGGMDERKTAIADKCTHQQQDEEGKFDQRSPKVGTNLKTPSTTCSEASWNSKSAFIQGLRKDPSRPNVQKQVSGKRIVGVFRCNCCFSKKSVAIEEPVDENRNLSNCKKNVDLGDSPDAKPTAIDGNPAHLAGDKRIRPEFRFKEEIGSQETDEMGVGSKREDCFTFPILYPLVENSTVERHLEREKKAPNSLEVFGSPFLGNENMGPNLEKSLNSLNLDTGTRIKGTLASSCGSGMEGDDIGSDTSSDLFEIEGLSSNVHLFFRPPESDGTLGSQAGTTGYQPSEASIDWSIFPSSAANISVASDSEDKKPIVKMTDPVEMILMTTTTTTTTTTTMTIKTGMVKEARRSISSSILNCRNDKAVQVVSNQYKLPERAKSDRRRRLRSDTMMPLVSFQPESRMAARSLSRSRSAHISQSLYMH